MHDFEQFDLKVNSDTFVMDLSYGDILTPLTNCLNIGQSWKDLLSVIKEERFKLRCVCLCLLF